MKNIIIKIQYVGTRYKGWQIQPNVATVEETMEQVFERVCQCPIAIKSSSRTDSGVHARGQVATVLVPQKIKLHKLFTSVNALLPVDIVLTDMVQIPLSFSARRDNNCKRYIYSVRNSPVRGVFDIKTQLWKRIPLDLEKLEKGLKLFEGSHNFAAYRGKRCQQPQTVKTIHETAMEVSAREGYTSIKLIFIGSGFLKNMVRVMVGTLLQIAENKIDIERIEKALNSGKREDAGLTAPALGLTLDKVFYSPDPFVTRGLDAWNQGR